VIRNTTNCTHSLFHQNKVNKKKKNKKKRINV